MFNFTEFIRRKWTEISRSSGQKGTVIDELAVKPTGLVLADFYNILVNQRRMSDITNWQDMSESDMDFFANKFFMPRAYGDSAFGLVRIWLDTKNTIEISVDTRFITKSGLQFKAIQPGFISGSSFVRSTDRFALYYIDVPIVAVNRGNSYNIVAGDITQVSDIDFVYKAVTNPDPFINGSAYENNEQYYKRLIYSINDRSMMNKRSVFAKLPEFFPIIKSIYVAGAGDNYMRRDLIEAVSALTPIKRVDFLGKVSGENIIKSVGFQQIYPLEAGNPNTGKWGPNSIPTAYNYPLTIEASDPNSLEPAFNGYALNQECTDDMYKGLFFDDFKTFMEVKTDDLFNIKNENTSFQKILIPSSGWIYGANGYYPSNMGVLSDGVSDIDVLNFINSTINISGGALGSICVGKDIKKRTGVKLAGTFKWPAVDANTDLTANSNLQLMIGGVNSTLVDAYTGVGFGIRVTEKLSPNVVYDPNTKEGGPNTSIYFAHAEAYGETQIYLSSGDVSSYNIGDITSLKETRWRIEPGIEYEFEFILHDDLRLTLYLRKSEQSGNDPTGELENNLHFSLPSNSLKVFGDDLLSNTTEKYGTMMKTVVNTACMDPTKTWEVTNLRAFDISEKRATAMFALNVDELESPVMVSTRASGSGNSNNLFSDGYIAYIWDKEAQSVATGSTELTSGAWAELPALSNPDGSKDVLTALLNASIFNIDRYRVQNKFGNNIFIMFITSGTSKLRSRYNGETEDDSQATLHIDYIKAESELTTSYHANNKADIYLTTLSNSENTLSSVVTVTKTVNESFFVLNSDNCKMPISEIISVTIGSTVNETQILSKSDYIVTSVDQLKTSSAKEELRIFLVNTDSDAITVEYKAYPSIMDIQSFFDGYQYGKIFGDILIKHKFPISLSFSIYYTGNASDTQLTDAIKKYFDENVRDIFVVKDMISYLYNQNFVNNVQEPITFSYTRYDDENVLSAGEFTDQIEARQIDFFRILSVTTGVL